MMGTSIVATNPRFARAAFTASGGTLVDVYTNSPATASQVGALLATLIPGFTFEKVTQATRVRSRDGGRFVQTVSILKWILDPPSRSTTPPRSTRTRSRTRRSSPRSGPSRRRAPSYGQMTEGDQTVLNPFNALFYANAGITPAIYTSATYPATERHEILYAQDRLGTSSAATSPSSSPPAPRPRRRHRPPVRDTRTTMRTKILLLASLLLAPALAAASGYEVIASNPRDLALSSSGVAAQVDPAAAFFNPAALSKLEGPAASVAGSMLHIGTEWTSEEAGGPRDASTEFHPVTPIAAYAGWGTKLAGRGFGVGVGVGHPFGGKVFWADDWAGRGRIIEVQRRFFGTYLNRGLRGHPAAPRRWRPHLVLRLRVPQAGHPAVPGRLREIDTRVAASATTSRPRSSRCSSIPFTIGVDYKHKAHMTLEGDGNFEVPPAFQSPPRRTRAWSTTSRCQICSPGA